MKLQVLIADDHRLVAEGVSGLLPPDYELIGIVENGRELVEVSEKSKPDLIIVDISMPQLSRRNADNGKMGQNCRQD
jgi:DNA-binding NarL/FixJ family response regulator